MNYIELVIYFETLISVLITAVSSIQRSLNTLQYYTGTQNGVLITEVSIIQRLVIEVFHGIMGFVCWGRACGVGNMYNMLTQ